MGNTLENESQQIIKECRICHESTKTKSMISPCHCSGSLKYVHKSCLSRWMQKSGHRIQCEICSADYDKKAVNSDTFRKFLSEAKELGFYVWLVIRILNLLVVVLHSVLCVTDDYSYAYKIFWVCFILILSIILSFAMVCQLIERKFKQWKGRQMADCDHNYAEFIKEANSSSYSKLLVLIAIDLCAVMAMILWLTNDFSYSVHKFLLCFILIFSVFLFFAETCFWLWLEFKQWKSSQTNVEIII